MDGDGEGPATRVAHFPLAVRYHCRRSAVRFCASFAQTIGAYFGMKQCKVGDKNCNLAIWVSQQRPLRGAGANGSGRRAARPLITHRSSLHSRAHYTRRIHLSLPLASRLPHCRVCRTLLARRNLTV